jgi:nucleoside-triphosphatase THEP1
MKNNTRDEYIDEMLLALEANIDYLRKEGSAQLLIKNGQFLNSVGDVYVYEFSLEFFQNIEPDTDIEIRIKNEIVNGRITAVNEKIIQVELERNIGQIIPEARLVISSYYLLQLLCEKLKKVKSGEIKFSDFSEKTFKLKPAKINLLKEYKIPDSSVSNLPNRYQEEALRLTLGSEVSFVWGPPGTGKTETIARIIEGLIGKNLSVLLLSHTNVATDGAMLNVAKHLETFDDYQNGRLLREGNIQKPELKKYEMVIPSVVIEKRGLPIKNEMVILTKKIEEITLTATKSKEIIKQFSQVEAIKKEIDNIKGDIKRKEETIKFTQETLETLKHQLLDTEEKINRCQSSGAIKNFFSGLNLEKLTRNKGALLIQGDKEKEKSSLNSQAISSAKNKLEKYYQEKIKIEKRIQGKNLEKHKNIAERTKNELKKLTEQRSLLQKQLESLQNSLIEEAKVIATTITKSYSSQIVLNREYDCVIVDEASMAPLPALWCAVGLAKQKVIIVGDFYQLPPVVKHRVLRSQEKTEEEIEKEEILVEKWLKKDIFETVGIPAAIKSGDKPDWLEQLKIQYRMHPDIANVVNLLIYSKGGEQFRLESAENTVKNEKKFFSREPFKNAHVGIYDTSNVGSLPARTDSGSYYNLYHAFLSVALAKQSIDNGYTSVGIISPFRPQTNLIQKIVRDEKLDLVEANTVHRFQGGEKQIIIFDITVPYPTRLTDDQKKGGDDEKLLNVAFSRAREKCIIIADIKGIEKKHSLTSLVREFINYCLKNNLPIISSEEILSKYSVTKKTETWLKKINNIDNINKEIEQSKLFDETDFYQNFIKDLFDAKQEVIIDSPFITSERIRIFMPIFEHLIDKGVNIFILTRQSKEHGTLMRYQAENEMKNLENLGITILPFIGRVHRKLAIIDRNILWEGSLNILSQRDSHEIMRRFAGKETAQQMMTFLKLNKNIGKIGENKLQRCEFCKEPGAWYWTDKSVYGGMWTFCLIGFHKLGKKPKTKKELIEIKNQVKRLRKSKKKTTSEGIPICPKHNLVMIKRKGPYGEFWGCPRYPACRIINKID